MELPRTSLSLRRNDVSIAVTTDRMTDAEMTAVARTGGGRTAAKTTDETNAAEMIAHAGQIPVTNQDFSETTVRIVARPERIAPGKMTITIPTP
jgi:hypothetical protein